MKYSLLIFHERSHWTQKKTSKNHTCAYVEMYKILFQKFKLD